MCLCVQVAACVCLFSLDKHAAIPVDTHVWQLAARYYTPHLKGTHGHAGDTKWLLYMPGTCWRQRCGFEYAQQSCSESCRPVTALLAFIITGSAVTLRLTIRTRLSHWPEHA